MLGSPGTVALIESHAPQILIRHPASVAGAIISMKAGSSLADAEQQSVPPSRGTEAKTLLNAGPRKRN